MTFETNSTTISIHFKPLGFCEALLGKIFKCGNILKFKIHFYIANSIGTWRIRVQNIVGAGVIELEHARSVATTQCWRDFTQNVQ